MDKKALVPLKKKVETLSQKVSSLVIKNSDDMSGAVLILSQLNKYSDSVKEKKEKITKPLLLALKNIRDMFSPLEEIYNDSINLLRNKISEYQTEQVKLKQQAENKIAERVSKGTLKVETAVKKIESLKPIEESVSTDAGTVKFREVKVLKVIDLSLVPREYFDLNESKLLKDLKEGKGVHGAELETKLVPINYRS